MYPSILFYYLFDYRFYFCEFKYRYLRFIFILDYIYIQDWISRILLYELISFVFLCIQTVAWALHWSWWSPFPLYFPFAVFPILLIRSWDKFHDSDSGHLFQGRSGSASFGKKSWLISQNYSLRRSSIICKWFKAITVLE